MSITDKLRRDITKLGLPIDYEIVLKDYSKSFWARYNPNTQQLILYLEEPKGKRLDYETLFTQALHETIHHYQWYHDPNFHRYKGTMHNDQFKFLYNYYLRKARKGGIIHDTCIN